MHRIVNRLLILGALVLVGCSKPAEEPVGGAGDDGAEPAAVESRFVVFSPAIGVMLRDLGFEDSIVGRHSYDSALSRSIPVVGSHIDIDYEMLITLSPTDVFFEINTIEIPERVRTLAAANDWQIWTYELKTLDDIAVTFDDLYLKLVGFEDAPKNDENFLVMDLDPTAKFDIDLPSARLARSWSDLGAPARNAGKTLVLAGIDPPGAMGPGSFHAQLIDRLGVAPAIVDGGMWQELDYEDIIALAPDSILIFAPKPMGDIELIGEPTVLGWDEILEQVGGLGELPIPAVEARRIAIIDHPLGLLPSSSLGVVADEVARAIQGWE